MDGQYGDASIGRDDFSFIFWIARNIRMCSVAIEVIDFKMMHLTDWKPFPHQPSEKKMKFFLYEVIDAKKPRRLVNTEKGETML